MTVTGRLLVVLLGLASALPLSAQDQTPPTFEVASIKRSRGDAASEAVFTRTHFRGTNTPLWILVQMASRVTPDLVFAPDWTQTERYDVNARVPAGVAVNPAVSTVMMRSLLEERFGMVAHHETRELPVYHLVLARDTGQIPAGLKRASSECPADARVRPGQPAECNTRAAAGEYSSGNMPMAQLARFLGIRAGRQVLDRTGLTGNFAFALTYAPEAPSPAARLLGAPDLPPGPADPNRPALTTALQEQLGLKLEPARSPVEVFVVDRIERPTED